MESVGKMSIERKNLVAIADALRAHFGEALQEGTTNFQPEFPYILKTPNYDDLSTSGSNGEYMAGEQVSSHTYKFHGASKLIIHIAHAEDFHMGTGGYNMDYIWVAPGTYEKLLIAGGQKFTYRVGESYRSVCPECESVVQGTGSLYRIGRYMGVTTGGVVVFEDQKDEELYRCPNCGLEGFAYPYDSEPGSNHDYWDDFSCVDQTLAYRFQFPTEFNSDMRKLDTLVFTGNSFTLEVFIWNETQKTGYYMEVYPVDEDGNVLDCCDVTVDYLPNVYTPDTDVTTSHTMVSAISKLNNYPDGEEVTF